MKHEILHLCIDIMILMSEYRYTVHSNSLFMPLFFKFSFKFYPINIKFKYNSFTTVALFNSSFLVEEQWNSRMRS